MLDTSIESPSTNQDSQNLKKIYGQLQSEISEALEKCHVPSKQNSMRTKQLWNWTFLGGVTELSEIKNMPKELLNQLSKNYTLSRNSIANEQKSNDGTIKWLVDLASKNNSTNNPVSYTHLTLPTKRIV